MNKIINPILKGFNPDPSICRVGDDYYIATSTFEWFPGVQIHHSKDLINWKLVTRPLSTKKLLDMEGNPCSGGIWAPCLSYNNGKFYLIYTDVKNIHALMKDSHNYLTTCDTIDGEWSDPIYMNSSGFDPSLFHDDDGKKWFVNMVWDHRKNRNPFAGILLQEFNEKEGKLVGEIKNIFKGSEIALTEAPHLYKKDGYYYLLTAEGGTSYDHACTIARSKNIDGPYELHPDNPIATAKFSPENYLQKTGHGSFVKTQNGEWYIALLMGRPIGEEKRCVLGRETSIQKIIWKDNWPYLSHGNNVSIKEVEGPGLPIHEFEKSLELDNFDNEELDINFQSLRVPMDKSWISLKERKGHLRLFGRESLYSKHKQSMIMRRQQSFSFEATTSLEFDPKNFQQMSGMLYFYNVRNWFYLYVSANDNGEKIINIMYSDKGMLEYFSLDGININAEKIYLRAKVEFENLQFYYSLDGKKWEKIGDVYDATKISDEYAWEGSGAFTGAFIGMCCQDLSGLRINADFDWFEYKELI